MSNVEGKVVVITGASSGIGEATALLLAEHGATVVLGARRSDRLEALADRVTQAGGAAAYATTDVTRREDLVALVALARDRFGKLDVLINNAGIGPNAPFDDLRVEEWTQMIDINVKGVLYGIAAALPVFREQAQATSSIPRPPRPSSSGRTWPSTPPRSPRCAPSPRACARRPATGSA